MTQEYLTTRVFTTLLVEHGILAVIGLLGVIWHGPAGFVATCLAVGTSGIVLSIVSFLTRMRSRIWARVASGFGIAVALVVAVSIVTAVVVALSETEIPEPCQPGWFECPATGGGEGWPVFFAILLVGLCLRFGLILAAHWSKHLRRGA